MLPANRFIGKEEPGYQTTSLPAIPLAMRVVGALAILAVGLIIYEPILGMGFKFEDDYVYLYWAASLPLLQYIIHTFDPYQVISYRPVFRLLILAEYYFFHSESVYYHLAQILLHCGNALLLAEIVRRLVRSWRTGVLAGLLYVALPVDSAAVFMISDQSPLVTFFCFWTILFWIDYLRVGSRWKYIFALASLALSILSKETAAVFPLVLFLADRVLVGAPANLRTLLFRYAPMAIMFIPYVGLEYMAQSQGVYFVEGGASFGEHAWRNYQTYWTLLALPWGSFSPDWDSILTAMFTIIFLAIAALRNIALLLVPIFVALALGLVLFYPMGAFTRYLYLPAVPIMVLWAMGANVLHRFAKAAPVSALLIFVVSMLLVWSGIPTADAAAAMSESARRGRVPFHDIALEHPSFPDGTRLFFVDPPSPVPVITGLLRLRYGAAVSVAGTIRDGELWLGGRLRTERAALRDYPAAYVYYFDEANRPIQVAVDKEADTHTTTPLPQVFDPSMQLDGYEITTNQLSRGQDLAVILYWRATGSIPNDYTVFVHLVDSKGEIIASMDGMPRNGQERTSQWKRDQLTADGHVLHISNDAPAGKGYHLEVGVYYLPTMQRLSIWQPDGSATQDAIVIEPFEISK